MSDPILTRMHDVLWRYDLNRVDAGRVLAEMYAVLAAEGMVVLGPDGEPLDVRPLVKWVGRAVLDRAFTDDGRVGVLRRAGITGPLAGACLAAAEVEG